MTHAYDDSPYDPEWNAAVRTIANHYMPNGFDTLDGTQTPRTLEETIEYFNRTGKIVVRNTIGPGGCMFSDVETLYSARAWHEWTHVAHKLPFTVEGEIRVCIAQIDDIRKFFSDHPRVDLWCAIARIEIVNKNIYFEATNGQMPPDHRRFALDGLAHWKKEIPNKV